MAALDRVLSGEGLRDAKGQQIGTQEDAAMINIDKLVAFIGVVFIILLACLALALFT